MKLEGFLLDGQILKFEDGYDLSDGTTVTVSENGNLPKLEVLTAFVSGDCKLTVGHVGDGKCPMCGKQEGDDE